MESKISEREGMPGDMSHPTNEQLVECLYGEGPSAAQEAVRKHLTSCAECRDKTGHWGQAMRSLDDWRWPLSRSRARREAPRWGGWAAAAAVLLLLGAASQMALAKTASLKSEQRIESSLRQK